MPANRPVQSPSSHGDGRGGCERVVQGATAGCLLCGGLSYLLLMLLIAVISRSDPNQDGAAYLGIIWFFIVLPLSALVGSALGGWIGPRWLDRADAGQRRGMPAGRKVAGVARTLQFVLLACMMTGLVSVGYVVFRAFHSQESAQKEAASFGNQVWRPRLGDQWYPGATVSYATWEALGLETTKAPREVAVYYESRLKGHRLPAANAYHRSWQATLTDRTPARVNVRAPRRAGEPTKIGFVYQGRR